MRIKTRELTLCAVLAALALALSYMESFFPLALIVPLPGVKLGLANIVTLYALYALGFPSALAILFVRCTLGALFAGNASALLFSLLGGLSALFVMALLSKSKKLSIFGVSIAGAAAHNCGQVCAALITLGSTAPLYYLPFLLLVSLFTGFLIGLGSGVNVEVARSLGAEDTERTEKNIHTSFIICAAVGVLLCLICRAFARDILVLLRTKGELLEGAVLYFSIYALGMPAMAVYNFGNGVLSAAGDTKRPLLYLTVSGILNVILNLFFVIECHMAADGVAIASVIAQVLSAVMITVHLCRRDDDCRLSLSKLRFNSQSARRVLMLGIPTGLQNAIFAVANMFVQTGVNTFDAVTVSGNSAAVNADSLIFNTQSAFYTACSSFISRNWGAGRKERILKSYIVSLAYSFAAGAICGVLLLCFGREFLSIFANEQAVIDAGMQRIKIMGFSYGICAFMDCSIAAARGLGKSIVPMIIVVLGSCVFRVVWIYTVFAFYKTIPALYLLYIFSWAITGAAETLYFRRVYRQCMAGTLA